MPVEDDVVEQRLRELAALLQGPRRLRDDLLAEARHGLDDAVEAYRDSGLSGAEAARRAVAEFGTAVELAPAYRAELAVAALRGLSLRVAAFAGAAALVGDLTWRGSSWSAGPPPPAGYLLLSAAVNWVWAAAFLCAAAGLVLATAGRRSYRPRLARLVGAGLTGAVALGVLTGVALFGWSAGLWDAARTWPPFVVGALLAVAAYAWLARSAHTWLRAAR